MAKKIIYNPQSSGKESDSRTLHIKTLLNTAEEIMHKKMKDKSRQDKTNATCAFRLNVDSITQFKVKS